MPRRPGRYHRTGPPTNLRLTSHPEPGYRGGVTPPRRPRPRAPAGPRLPPSLTEATLAEHDLADEATLFQLAVALDLSGRTARLVEIEQCRFQDADLSGTTLTRARLRDCAVTRANLANLHAEQSSLVRGQLSGSRLTGLHWVGGSLREVRISQCRADLAVFRFSNFRQVRFERCNLTRADFQDAELGGAEFVDCDLSGAQFSSARMRGTRFHGCVLSGIGGVGSFDGAVIAAADLLALSYPMAAALGIQVEDPDGG